MQIDREELVELCEAIEERLNAVEIEISGAFAMMIETVQAIKALVDDSNGPFDEDY